MTQAFTVCPINKHSLLLIKGPDARKFLQGQVTCDIETLNYQAAENQFDITHSLGAHCTHKGRVVFSFRAIPLNEHTIALQIPNDIIETATAALQKYIVFSKAEIINANAEYRLYGFNGDKANSILQQLLNMTHLPEASGRALQNSKGTVLCISPQRYELWLTIEQEAVIKNELTQRINEESHYWDLLNIHAGIAEIRQATSGLFTPHAINFHQVEHAISFHKGCYTGQEVVARMHYLGKLKRELFLVEIPLTTLAEHTVNDSDPIYSSKKTQSCGDIIMSTKHNQSLYALISAAVEQVTENNISLDVDGQYPLHHMPIANQ